MRDLFLLRDDVVFLNHGSFGACPRAVMAEYQRWQLELERQPVEFLARRFRGLMQTAREALAAYVGAGADELVFVTNATTAVNIVAHSLPLGPGDEVVVTDHEYGAVDRIWRLACARGGATLVRAVIPVPVTTAAGVVEHFWSTVTPRTRFEYQGTRDPAPFLAVPAAIAFQQAHHWDAVWETTHALAARARDAVTALTGLNPLSPDDPAWFAQMVSVPLPVKDPRGVQRRLREEFGIEVVVTPWHESALLRVSVQAYNTPGDIDRLVAAVETVLR